MRKKGAKKAHDEERNGMSKREAEKAPRGGIDEWIDKIMFWLLCLFAVALSLSVAAANVAMGLLLPLTLYRLWRQPPDWRGIWRIAPGVFGWFAFFALSAFLSVLAAPDGKIAVMTFVNFYLYRLFPAALVFFWVKDKERLWILAGCLLASIFFNNLIAIWQAFKAPTLMNARFGGVIGLMAQAGLLSAAVPLLALVMMRRGEGRWVPLGPVMMVIAVIALLLNGARGAWLAASIAVTAVVVVAARHKMRCLAGLGLTFLLLGAVFTQIPAFHARLATLTQPMYQSNSERLLMWQSAFHAFQDHPLLGVGLGNYTHAYQTKYISPEAKERQQGHAHSNVMQMMGERGGVGAAAFCGMWLYFMVFSLRGWMRRKEPAYLAFLAIVLGVMLQGLTEYNMGTVVVSKAYWFSLAICLQWIALTRKERIA